MSLLFGLRAIRFALRVAQSAKPLSSLVPALRMNKEIIDTLVFVSIADGHCKKFRHGDDLYLFPCVGFDWNGIADNEFFERAVLDVFVCFSAEHRVCYQGSYATGAFVL